jgi:hypothetical protein
MLSGAVTKVCKRAITLAGSITMAGGAYMAGFLQRILSGTLTSTGTVSKYVKTSRVVSGVLRLSGQGRRKATIMWGDIYHLVRLGRQAAGSLSPTGVISRMVHRQATKAGELTFSGSATGSISLLQSTIEGVLSFAGVISRIVRGSAARSANLTFSGAATALYGGLAGSVAISGELTMGSAIEGIKVAETFFLGVQN